MTEGIIKTQDEINSMLRAVQIIDDTYDAVLETIKEGDTEKDVAKFIE